MINKVLLNTRKHLLPKQLVTIENKDHSTDNVVLGAFKKKIPTLASINARPISVSLLVARFLVGTTREVSIPGGKRVGRHPVAYVSASAAALASLP